MDLMLLYGSPGVPQSLKTYNIMIKLFKGGKYMRKYGISKVLGGLRDSKGPILMH